MRFDIENQLSAVQAFTGAATVSTNSYQKQAAVQDISIGRRMALLCMVTVASGDAGSTHVMEAIQATDAALTTSLDVLGTTSILGSVLIVGYAFEVPFPQGTMDKQFLGFRNTSTGPATTITMDVYLVPQDEIQFFKSFPKAVDADV